jgi:hypothetical protein
MFDIAPAIPWKVIAAEIQWPEMPSLNSDGTLFAVVITLLALALGAATLSCLYQKEAKVAEIQPSPTNMSEEVLVTTRPHPATALVVQRVAVPHPSRRTMRWFHGDITRVYSDGLAFYHYPLGRPLPNPWDTHLAPGTFCSNFKSGSDTPDDRGVQRYICLGHDSYDAFAEAEMEWSTETYTAANNGPLRHCEERRGVWTDAEIAEWKKKEKNHRLSRS